MRVMRIHARICSGRLEAVLLLDERILINGDVQVELLVLADTNPYWQS